MLTIKELRMERGWSQRALAAKIQSSQKAVALWEKGEAEPTAHFIIALSDVFECSADYLLSRSDDFGNVRSASDLPEDERALLLGYRNLCEEEKKLIRDFTRFLSER